MSKCATSAKIFLEIHWISHRCSDDIPQEPLPPRSSEPEQSQCTCSGHTSPASASLPWRNTQARLTGDQVCCNIFQLIATYCKIWKSFPICEKDVICRASGGNANMSRQIQSQSSKSRFLIVARMIYPKNLCPLGHQNPNNLIYCWWWLKPCDIRGTAW